MVWLYWRWHDSDAHVERRAAYESLTAALGQAEHDLELARKSGDYTTAPTRVDDDAGVTLWTADLPNED